MYDHDGEPVTPRDVLDDEELREYADSLRDRARPMPRVAARDGRCDEYGYDRDGRYHVDQDGIDPWERR